MTTELTDSECLALLADRRRRIIVRTLHDVGTGLSLDELAERITDREHERPTADERRTVRLALTHNHLPRLEDYGIVSFDRDDRTVSLRPNGQTLVDYLARGDDASAAGTMPSAFHARFPTPRSERR